MAVKNSLEKQLSANCNIVMDILRNPKFSALIEADFVEEAKTAFSKEGKTATCIEFRYVRKTTPLRYGRNFFINVPQTDGDTTTVTVTTQSRKVTVVLDTVWQSEVKRVVTALEAMIP